MEVGTRGDILIWYCVCDGDWTTWAQPHNSGSWR